MRLTVAIVMTAFVAVSLGSSSLAIASNDLLSSEVVGGLCTPDSRSIREALYATAGFGVRVSAAHLRADHPVHVRLLCPFHRSPGVLKNSAISMSVIDADGMGIGARVRAHLRRARVGTNAADTIGSCDSNTSNDTGPHQLVCPFSASLEGGQSYWFEIEIEQNNRAVEVEFLSVGVKRSL